MSSEEELNELKESRETVEIKNAFGESVKGPIVSVEEDRVIYKGLKVLADGKGYQKDQKGRAIVMKIGDLITNIQITRIKDKKIRESIESAICIIEKNKENQKTHKKEENLYFFKSTKLKFSSLFFPVTKKK